MLDHPDETRQLSALVRADLNERFDARKQARALTDIYRELAPLARRPSLGVEALRAVQRGAHWLRDRRRNTNVTRTDVLR
jgi:hypothetical protein